jgi:Core-2/I-Branching enzyme
MTIKVCYFLQTHTNPKQIYRLVRTIKKSSPNSLVIISHDFTKSYLDVRELQNWTGVKVLSGKGGRGNFTTVQRFLDSVDWILNNEIEFDWLINLTGQDYPVQPLAQIESFLSETSYDGFLEYTKVFSSDSTWGIREGYTRYYYKYHSLINNLPEGLKYRLRPLKIVNYLQPFFRVDCSYSIKIGLRTSVPFTEDFICYGGSFFCTLSKKCIQYLQNFYQSKPDIINYYKGVCQSDESFLQTLLVNSKLFNFCNDSKRYYDFSITRNGHPRTLIIKDYQPIVESGKHFARKFDINIDDKILDLLDARIETLSHSSGNIRSA